MRKLKKIFRKNSTASGEDAWVIKLNTRGNKVWDNTFAKRTDDEIFSIIQTKEGGYAVCGYTGAKGWGEVDSWVAKLDENGDVVWDKAFGGIEADVANSIIQTRDGGYALAGYTWSKGAGREDAWVIKLDENGEVVWDKTFGGSDEDVARCIIQAEDGGYVLAGYTESKGAGRYDVWVIKLNEKGNLE